MSNHNIKSLRTLRARKRLKILTLIKYEMEIDKEDAAERVLLGLMCGKLGLVRVSPLKMELGSLSAKWINEYNRMVELERQFWDEGGTCCPMCGIPNWHNMVSRQNRRLKRAHSIMLHLWKSSRYRPSHAKLDFPNIKHMEWMS